jgi:exodeoxyribonuclease-5
MKLSSAQENAVTKIKSWFTDDSGVGTPQIFTLGGYAGTGKTTIISAIIEALGSRVHCCAPTGKAVSVLEGKLPPGVPISTIHSFLYQPVDVTENDVMRAEAACEQLKGLAENDPAFRDEYRASQKRFDKLVKTLEAGGCEFREQDDPNHANLLIVDEASMVGDILERDLCRNANKILCVGDPGQLPPVEGTEFFKRHQPDVLLEEIHRQAAESNILRFATAIRKGETFRDWDKEQCRLFRGSDITDAMLAKGDVLITGKNITRRELNKRLRGHHGRHSDYPEKGEPLMCLKNDHGKGLINGIAGVAASDAEMDSFEDLRMDVAYGDKVLKGLPIDPFHFDVYREPKLNRRNNPPRDSQWDFGHAITCHKSQGSEWPHVIVWDDKMRVNDTETRKRWIYTAATRAGAKLSWINGTK